MDKDTTQNKLLKLIYNELPPNEAVDMLNELSKNPTLYHNYKEMKEVILELNSFQKSPHQTSVQIILEESCSSSPMKLI